MDATDGALALGVRNKDVLIFEKLIDLYTPSVRYIISKILLGQYYKQDIEECISDAFFRVWINIEKYDANKASFKTFIYLMAKYTALDYRRKTKNNIYLQLSENEVDYQFNLEETVLQREDQKLIMKFIDQLPEVDRLIFKRRYFFNEDIVDLASKYQLSRQAVDNRLYRIRQSIKKILKED